MGVRKVPARVSVGILVTTGTMVLYMLRVNLSVAIVAMARAPPSTSSSSKVYVDQPYCKELPDTPLPTDIDTNSTNLDHVARDMEMTDQIILTGTQKGMVLGAFFYGYILSSIPGGRLAELYGTKVVFGGSILTAAILTLLTPLAAKLDYIVLIILRILIGIAQGVVYPSMHVLVARWIPPLERSRFISITYMGNCLGTIVTLSACGVIIDSLGWEAAFYICGGIAILWVILWSFLMFDSPIDHPRISDKEREFIIDAIAAGTSQKKPKTTPWKAIVTSIPIWAINISHIGGMFGFTLLITQLPTYFKSVLGFSIKNNGLLSSLPFLAQFLGSTSCGCIGDYLLTRKYITVATSRKLFTTISLAFSGIALVAVGYAGCNVLLTLLLFPVSAACLGGFGAGHLANQLDLAPNFAGTLMGFSNTIAFGVSMLAPIMVGALTPDQTLQQWQYVFWITACLQIICWLFFMVFSKYEIQPWNNHCKDCSPTDPEQKEGLCDEKVNIKITKNGVNVG